MPDYEELLEKQRRRLLKRESALVRDLRELYAGAIDEAVRKAERSIDLVERRLAQGENPLSALISARRANTFIQQLSADMDALGQQSASRIEVDRRAAVVATAADFIDIAEALDVSVGIDPEAITRQGLALQRSSPVAQLFDNAGEELAILARQELFAGVALGENPRKVARRLQPLIVGRRNRAETIARTEVLRSYRGAMRERMKANDAIAEWVWISARDRRTCAMCWAMHGTRFPKSTIMGTHPNCRCSMGPAPARSFVDVPRGEELFEQLSPALQRQILGPGKFKAYTAGRITLGDLVGQAYHAKWGPIRFERSLSAALGGRQTTPAPRPPRPTRTRAPRPAPPPPPPPPANFSPDTAPISASTRKLLEKPYAEWSTDRRKAIRSHAEGLQALYAEWGLNPAWSGKISFRKSKSFNGAKEWNCDITMDSGGVADRWRHDTLHTMTHEVAHSIGDLGRVSPYEFYGDKSKAWAEEAINETFARQVSRRLEAERISVDKWTIEGRASYGDAVQLFHEVALANGSTGPEVANRLKVMLGENPLHRWADRRAVIFEGWLPEESAYFMQQATPSPSPTALRRMQEVIAKVRARRRDSTGD